jgi:hypothetical protein
MWLHTSDLLERIVEHPGVLVNKIDRNTIWCRINIFMMENISLFTLNHPMCCTELIWPELRNQIRKTNFQLFHITNNRNKKKYHTTARKKYVTLS